MVTINHTDGPSEKRILYPVSNTAKDHMTFVEPIDCVRGAKAYNIREACGCGLGFRIGLRAVVEALLQF